jgi:hypothetical protein
LIKGGGAFVNEQNKLLPMFKNKELEKFTHDEQMLMFANAAMYLGFAAMICENDTYHMHDKEIWEYIKKAGDIGYRLDCDVFNSLYSAVASFCSFDSKRESYYVFIFCKIAPAIIRGCKIVKRRMDGRNIPDAWIEIDGVQIPVEAKRGVFGQKALNQLERYIHTYNSLGGIAIGAESTETLPDDIMFISTAQIEKTLDVLLNYELSEIEGWLRNEYEESVSKWKKALKSEKK